MGRVTKFDNTMQSRILELASLGYSLTDISKLLSVSRNTLHRWIRKYDLKQQIDDIEHDVMRSTIKRGLIKLAEGVKTVEESIKTIEEDDAGRPVERVQRIKELPPSEKAIQILASHYDKRFGNALDNDAKHLITHDINVNIMSQRELNELRQLNVLDAECRTVSSESNAELLPETINDATPPNSEQEQESK
jgi:transposase-like protein